MDVGGWLRSLGLGQYEAAFHDNAIDAEVLRELTADYLKDLGVGLVGHRRQLLAAIAAPRVPVHRPNRDQQKVPGWAPAPPVRAGTLGSAR